MVFAVMVPFLGRFLWWLRGDFIGVNNWLSMLLTNLALFQVVLLFCAGVALWLHRLEAKRSRSPQQHASWWLFAPSIRWLLVGTALFFLLGFQPRFGPATGTAKPAAGAVSTPGERPELLGKVS